MEYFIIGERELVLGFNLVGVQGQVVNNRAEALSAFQKMTGTAGEKASSINELPKILILTEDVSDMLREEVLAWQKKGTVPLLVEVPGLHGHIPGRKSLTESIREAVGISI